jgi:ribosomal-protein-alanine N-acetyltransferase
MLLKTNRLLLRPIQPSDLPSLIKLWSNPDVTRFMGGPRQKDELQKGFTEDIKNPTQGDYDLWPVLEKASGQLVGHCGLLDKEVDRVIEIELVYVFDHHAWGKGFASEIASALKNYAFQKLRLNRLIALIEPENAASERVAIKVGMTLENETLRPGGRLMRVYSVINPSIKPARPQSAYPV